jgi:hypothetical protein
MTLTVEHTRQLECKWNNLIAIVHDIEIDDAITEQIKNATPGPSFCDTEA